jgi:hypothetical protein
VGLFFQRWFGLIGLQLASAQGAKGTLTMSGAVDATSAGIDFRFAGH